MRKTAAAMQQHFELAMRHPELGDRERLLLQAYIQFEAQHGARCGHPGVCWPTDAELSEYLGRSAITMRRARRALGEPSLGIIRIDHLPPFRKLPDGSTTWHGCNLVTILELAGDVAPARTELANATGEILRLERALAKARAQADAIADRLAKAKRAPSSRNAPCLIGLEGSSQLPLFRTGEGTFRPRLVA